MGSDGVVVVAPLLDEDPGFLEAAEDLPVEKFVPQLAVEAFAIAVLPGASVRPTIDPLDRLLDGLTDVEGFGTHARQPDPHNPGGHLRPVVGSDVLGNAPNQHHVCHGFQNAQAVDPSGDPDRQAFPGELIDQRHQPHIAAIPGLGLHKVIGPDIVALFRAKPDAGAVIETQSPSWPLFTGYF